MSEIKLKKYIDIDDVRRVMHTWAFTEGVEKDVNNIPAADVEPVRHGRWTYICNSPMTKLKVVECSVCHNRTYGSTKYCPNCGAKMDGDTE